MEERIKKLAHDLQDPVLHKQLLEKRKMQEEQELAAQKVRFTKLLEEVLTQMENQFSDVLLRKSPWGFDIIVFPNFQEAKHFSSFSVFLKEQFAEYFKQTVDITWHCVSANWFSSQPCWNFRVDLQ